MQFLAHTQGVGTGRGIFVSLDNVVGVDRVVLEVITYEGVDFLNHGKCFVAVGL